MLSTLILIWSSHALDTRVPAVEVASCAARVAQEDMLYGLIASLPQNRPPTPLQRQLEGSRAC